MTLQLLTNTNLFNLIQIVRNMNAVMVKIAVNGLGNAHLPLVVDFKKLTLKELKQFGKNEHVLYDIKYLLDKNQVDGRLKMCKIFNEFFK